MSAAMAPSCRAVLAAMLALAAGAARAHDFWIEPATFRPAVGQRFGVALRLEDHHAARAVPRDAAHIAEFAAYGPTGRQVIIGKEGRDPAGIARVDAAGSYALVYRSTHERIVLDAKRFATHLREQGLDVVAVGAERRGAPTREAYARYAKALIMAGGPGEPVDQPVGLRLELVAEPVASDAPRTFRLLFEGEPLAGALVRALAPDGAPAPTHARTDAAGRVAFSLAAEGMWVIAAVHMIEPARGLDADWESLWASLSLEVRAPS